MIVLIYVCACPCESQRLTLEETTRPDLGIMQCLCGMSIAHDLLMCTLCTYQYTIYVDFCFIKSFLGRCGYLGWKCLFLGLSRFVLVWGIELRASHKPSKHCATELHLSLILRQGLTKLPGSALNS